MIFSFFQVVCAGGYFLYAMGRSGAVIVALILVQGRIDGCASAPHENLLLAAASARLQPKSSGPSESRMALMANRTVGRSVGIAGACIRRARVECWCVKPALGSPSAQANARAGNRKGCGPRPDSPCKSHLSHRVRVRPPPLSGRSCHKLFPFFPTCRRGVGFSTCSRTSAGKSAARTTRSAVHSNYPSKSARTSRATLSVR